MKALVVFEEREYRELISFVLEGLFDMGVQEAGSTEEAISVLGDSEQAFDILVCDYAKAAKPLISFALSNAINLHFLCCANKAPDDVMLLQRKEWVHFFPNTTMIEGLEAKIRQLFKEFQSEKVPDVMEFCRIKPQTLLNASPLKGNIYVRLSDSKYVRIMREGFDFDVVDFDYFIRKKKIEILFVKKQNCKAIASQIQTNIQKRLKAGTTSSQPDSPQSIDLLEAKKKKLEVLKERAKALEAERRQAIEDKKKEQDDKNTALSEAHAKLLEEKRAAMIQAKAKEILDRKTKSEELHAARSKVKDTASLEKAKQEAIQKLVLAKKLEKELGAELEVVGQMSNRLGFTKEVQELTKQSVMQTVHQIRNAPQLSALLLQLRKEKDKYISSHSMLLAYVGCALASQMEWSSDTTFQKITMAAFLHDITLKNQELAMIQSLPELAKKQSQFSKEDLKVYREHPIAGAEIARKFQEVPPDVDSIIAQHHERPDGSGFPRGLTHVRIGPLATVFIVAHDLVCYLFEKDISDPTAVGFNLDQFLEQNHKTYQFGNFRKVLSVVPRIKA